MTSTQTCTPTEDGGSTPYLAFQPADIGKGMVTLILRMLAALSALVLSTALHAQVLEPIEAPVGNNHAQAFDKMRYWISDEAGLDPSVALSQRSEFQPVTSPWIDFGDQEGAVWLLLQVANSSEQGGDWLVDIQRPFVEELLVAKVDGEAVTQSLLAVDSSTSFEDRPVVSQYLVAPLPLAAGETAELLVGMRSTTGSWMPLTIVTPERMRTAHMQEARFNWTINGAILALVIAAIAMGRLVGWKLALAFVGYAGLSALFVANNEGYLHRFVWPDAMWAYEPANLILLNGMMIAVLQFARLFADLKTHVPQFSRIVLAVQGALLVLLLASFVLWQADALRWLTFGLVPVAALCYFVTAGFAWRARVLGAVPFMAGSLAILFTVVVMAAVLLVPGRFPMTVALDYFHATLLFEALAFFVAIVVRMLAVQRDLNRSLAAEVVATQEKLQLAEQLQQSRERYDAARQRAESMRSRLASTSHDLQQPLLSLRQDLQRLSQQDEAAAGKLASALDYLEAVTSTGLSDSAPEDSPLAGEKPDEGVESFPISVVLDNCAAMFGGEAEKQGVDLRVRAADISVRADPVALMRAVSNLLSNALKHGQASKILLGTHTRNSHVIIRVVDNGIGMEADQLAELRAAYAKGEDSEGHGLGLALVEEFAQSPGHSLDIRTEPGKGTSFALWVPRGD